MLGKRIPIFISWSLTHRCPYQCLYCSSWKRKGPELNADQICHIIDDLAKCGTSYISFTGGEPFLKESLIGIVRNAVENKIIININSSGFGVKENQEVLTLIDSLTLSLDGPEEIHNSIRGDSKAFEKVIEAARLGKKVGVKVKLFAVINKNNIDSIDNLLQIAEDLNCPVGFQPATFYKLRGEEVNPIDLSNQETYQVLESLIIKKKDGARISNSITGLRALQSQIYHKPPQCWAGKVSFRIDPDGTLHVCPRAKDHHVRIYVVDGIKQGIDKLERQYPCSQCCCTARTELNCILSGKIGPAMNQFWSK